MRVTMLAGMLMMGLAASPAAEIHPQNGSLVSRIIPATVTKPDRQSLAGVTRISDAAMTGAIEAVWAMLGGFGRRSETEFVAWMSDDFLFTSDDADFVEAFPNGMTREDERRFAEKLFRGGARGPGGVELPRATRVDTSAGPIFATPVDAEGSQARVILEHLHVRITLSDSSIIDLRDTHSVMDLTLTEAGWRVSRWREFHPSSSALEALEQRFKTAVAGGAPERAELRPGVPERMELVPRADHSHDVMVFELALPQAGGVLELFDVLGRRIAQQVLADLRPGRHRVALDGASYPSGVYWARLRQESEARTAKIVWTR